MFGIVRKVHIGHPTPAELSADFVLSELAAGKSDGRDDHGLRPPRNGLAFRKGVLTFRKKLVSRMAFMFAPSGKSRPFFSNTFPTSAGFAPSWAATPARPLRNRELCESHGMEGPEMRIPSAEESRTELPTSTGEAAPRISIPTP